MDEAEVAVGSFIVPGCQPAGAFELVEAALDHVSQGIDREINGQLDQPVALGRDHRNSPAPLHIFTNEVSVIAFVGQEFRGCSPVGVHDWQLAFEIGDFTTGQRDRYEQAQRIDAEMDRASKATF